MIIIILSNYKLQRYVFYLSQKKNQRRTSLKVFDCIRNFSIFDGYFGKRRKRGEGKCQDFENDGGIV